MRRLTAAAVAALLTLAFAGLASAHVEVQQTSAPPGDLAPVTIQVPNESETASTTSIAVQIPEGVDIVRVDPKPGWKYALTKEKLTNPSTSGDLSATERVKTITWTGGPIAPGEFTTFSMLVATPDTPGKTITFPTVQTYSDGKVSRWIGAEGSDLPAPQIAIAAEEGGTDAAAATSSDSGKTNWALGLGIAGLVVGLGALALVLVHRRKKTA
jgi:periplasmic copper chaperone A